MESWHSYPSLFAIGHRALAEMLLDKRGVCGGLPAWYKDELVKRQFEAQ